MMKTMHKIAEIPMQAPYRQISPPIKIIPIMISTIEKIVAPVEALCTGGGFSTITTVGVA